MEQHRNQAARPKGPPKCHQDERRKQPRLHCKGVAEISVLSVKAKIPGTLLDLSVSGCCIHSSLPLPSIENPFVEVHLHVKGISLRLAGVVRHVRKDHRAGIEFVDVTSRKAEQIKELIQELLEMEHDSFANTHRASVTAL